MILVMLGTQNNSFHRLLEEIDKLIKENMIKEEVIVQAGYTKYETNNMKIIDLMPKEELEELQNKADLIITHGGVGSIISSLEKGKKVIAIPRLSKYGEHVDDHQIQLIKEFEEMNFIEPVYEIDELGNAIRESKEKNYNVYVSNTDKIIEDIEKFIGEEE